jgi:N-acetylglucosaminyldiphosphoundecaprenol N-acetyl-beta-D-mannosaminyltransferase
VFLYGSAPGVAARAAAVAAGRHPGLQIAGTHHGFDGDGAAVADEIRRAAPDFLFVGLGTPAQERWIARHRERLPVALAMGVGGSFDVLAGHVRRAPRALQRSGLEWAFRLAQEPRRLGGRYLSANSRFLMLLLRARLGRAATARVA